VDIDKNRPKLYVLDMFPYPSGAGLHVGHPLGYIASDIYSRYKRLQGYNVLHPMGYDAFGLPAEQYAIQTGQHPAVTTHNNIARYRAQLNKIGFSYDWSREVRTCDPDYYKWTQWAFLKMFDSYYCCRTQRARPIDELIKHFEEQGTAGLHAACSEELHFTSAEWNAKLEAERQQILFNYRLAYLGETVVNWSADLGTVLANDEVKDGLSVRGGFPVEQKKMKQWMLRVSAYAERLLTGLDALAWTDSLKEMQRNWIGRSEGAEIRFPIVRTEAISPLSFRRGAGGEDGCLQISSPPSPLSQGRGGENAALPFPEGEGLGVRTEAGTEDIEIHISLEKWRGLIERAKQFRHEPTEAEHLLWTALRDKKTGHKIRRQHIIKGFIADFYCLATRTIIEVDGGVHNTAEQREHDEYRTSVLQESGFNVIRFTNEEVLNDVEGVTKKIRTYLDNCASPLSFRRGAGGEDFRGEITVFTTRADTIFGVTFMVLAPESEWVDVLTTEAQRAEVERYLQATKKKTERERIADRQVSGVFSGAYAVNPVTNEEIPIWISDYVLAGYGTGAIMAVPAHDSRDYAFAKHFNLPIIPLIEGCDVSDESFDAKEGVMMNSPRAGAPEGGLVLNGLDVKSAIAKTKTYIEAGGLGKIKVNYRLRDAVFSRQRYWGEPVPIYYKDGVAMPVPFEALPLQLPEVDKFLPTETGEPPLGRAKDWNYNGCPIEKSTMPGFAGSSAYYLRYMDPHNGEALVDKDVNAYWRNVDLYIGGTEHATGHLIYSRFWNKFLFDYGYVCEDEPFKKLINQGMILGRSNFVYRVQHSRTFVSHGLKDRYDTQELHVDVNLVSNDRLDLERFKQSNPDYAQAEFVLEDGEYICGWAVEKMSKSYFNVVNPDTVCEQYGADTLRLYEMFLGPLEQSKPWDMNGIDGVHRFLRKFWRLFHPADAFAVTSEAPQAQEWKVLHRLIKKVQDDMEAFSFNTTVSAFMIGVNELGELKCNKRAILEPLVILLSPYAPHIAEELWEKLGHADSVTRAQFPKFEEAYTVENMFEYPVSFNGKLRFKKELALDLSPADIEKAVLADAQAAKYLDGKPPKKVVVVPGKIVNVVV
jgi:leucyl-tRNA synthetase